MSKKILLVDDSATVLMMERMVLASEGVELFTAKNGLEAQQKAKQERPDLILMDVVMPQVDGLQACRAIRADPDTKHIPIIMVTTRGENTNVEDGYQSGCSEYITKPINSAELLRMVRHYLGGKS
jgi:CheY-like chemotaxis protein